MRTKMNRMLALLLTLVAVIGLFPTAALAAEQGDPGTVTETYINEADGREIAAAETYTTAEEKNPQTIDGYEYESFSEVIEHVYAKEDLTYIIGYPDKTVRGERYLSRSEAAAIFYRLYDGFYPELQRQMKSTTFSDIPQGAWYYTEVELCYNVGIISGYEDGTFKPDDPITRAEFAMIAAKFAELALSGKAMFKDVTKDHWAYQLINSAAIAGWIQGYPDGTYRPESTISRSEAVTLINRMRNRSITVEHLKELGVKNPYTDLVETYWAYTDLMEATVKHAATDWHDLTFNDGNLNIIIEKYVDEDGNEIADTITTKGKTNYACREFDRHYYLGYITTITYVYSDGAARMIASKSADKSTANVGDTLTYSVTVGNAKSATASLENVIMTDSVPEYLTFTQGSVLIDGVSAKYAYNSKTKVLSVEVGDLAPAETKTIKFDVTVNEDAYSVKIINTAVISADDYKDKTVTDKGVTIADGAANIIAEKSVCTPTAKVGDLLIYTVTVSNPDTATASLENVVMTDEIPEYVTFAYGSVQVDGLTARYAYDNAGKLLAVELGDIAAGQTKTVTFSAVVNASAYGKTFKNTAVITADNDDDESATDGGVTVGDGTAEGSVGAKTVSSPTASVGDTLTYTITLRNASTATAAWTGIEVADVIPEYLSFVSGSVEEDGRASTNVSYDAGSKTLTLYADSIEPGESRVFTFKATVQDGAQGMYIVNTAVVSSDDRKDIQLPDTGVQIDSGNTAPYVTKSASVTEARPGDIFSYTVTVKNGADATAAWKNVILSDVLPTGVKLVSGSVTLNGKTVSYGIAGQAIEVTVGDLAVNEEAVISFEVRVLDSAAGTTVTNVAVAKGDNGEQTATDKGVIVPNPEDDDTDDTANKVTGSKNVDKTIVNTGDKVTYTITATNNTDEVWTGVQVYDVLDTSVLTLIDDSIYINGVRYLSGSGKWSFTDKQLVINLGDIETGKTVAVHFTVQFKNDAANSTYTNHATIVSTSHDNVYVKAPEVYIAGGGGTGDTPNSYTEIHYKLFIGNDDGEWKPNADMRLDHMCLLGYRLMTDYYRSTLGNGSVTVPDSVKDREAQFFISHGIISAAEYETNTAATQSQIYRILNYAVGAGLSSNGTSTMSRASVASLICDLTGRDKTPNTNGLAVAYFPDKGSYAGLIDEVSNSHDYTLDSSGNETWISILKD